MRNTSYGNKGTFAIVVAMSRPPNKYINVPQMFTKKIVTPVEVRLVHPLFF